MSINDLLDYKWDVSTLFIGLSLLPIFCGIMIMKNPSEKAPKWSGIVLTVCGGLILICFSAMSLFVEYY